MQRFALLLFIVTVVGSTVYALATGQDLPVVMPSHFGHGEADSYMPRSGYLTFFVCLVAGVPLFIAGAAALLVRNAPQIARGQNAQFWDENRELAVEYVTSRTLILCAVLSLFLAAVHHMVVRANRVRPPALPFPDFPILLGGFVVLFFVLAIAFGLGMNRMARAGRFDD